MGPEESVKTAQTDVRIFVDLLNQVLSENRLLRRELERRRAVEGATEQYEVSAVPPPGADQGPDVAEAYPAAGSQRIMRPGVSRRRMPAPEHGSASVSRRPVRRSARDVTREQHEERISHQLEKLTSELQSLRSEIRSTRMLSATDISQPVSISTLPATRFQPIRSNHEQESFEVEYRPGMWMKLHEPWFYVPLIWATILGAVMLAAFLFIYR